ncbi:MAG: GNAT family N-acetyltransferase [Frankia sp.]|nr:GNAT family N-acetyltransferase [Frankia sp.]
MLTGERVTLRPVKPEDYEQFYAWRLELETWGDTTDMPPHPMTLEAFKRRSEEGALAPEKAVTWSVDVAGSLVGRASIFAFDDLARNAEVGLVFAPEHRGKGYGKETLRLLVDFGFVHRNLHRISAANARSVDRVARGSFVVAEPQRADPVHGAVGISA